MAVVIVKSLNKEVCIKLLYTRNILTKLTLFDLLTRVSSKIKNINISKTMLTKPSAIKLVRQPKNSARIPPNIKHVIGIMAIIAVIFDICLAASAISKQSLKIVLPTDKQAAAPNPCIHLKNKSISIFEENEAIKAATE
jgi:hypothetical protein